MMDEQPPSYDVSVRSQANIDDFFSTCRQARRSKSVVEKELLKNRDDQRTVYLQLIRTKEKIMSESRKLRNLELKKARLEETCMRLEEEHRNAHEVG
jgi:hypothetical protein